MFRPYDQDQMFLLPPSVKEFIDEKHPAHLINDLVEKLDIKVFILRYGEMGQPAYSPRMMLKVILYGMTVGVFSSRKLSRACRENLAFKYLAGMQTPAFKTFIEYRARHREEMADLFVQTVKLAKEMGFALLSTVALDGTKMRADTSKHKAMSYGRMQEEEKKLKAEMEALLQKAQQIDEQEAAEVEGDGFSLSEELALREKRLAKIEEAISALRAREERDHPKEPIDSKRQISFADPDARCFTKKSDGTDYIYNSQAAVDMESQIIVENHIEDCVSDAQAAETSLTKIEKEQGVVPDHMVMDSGYATTATLEVCERHEVTPVCAPFREKGVETSVGARPEEEKGYRYNSKENRFLCPHGVIFFFSHWTPNGKRAVYRSQGESSCFCGRRNRWKGYATLTVRKSHLAMRRLKEIKERPEMQALYRRRKSTVEPVFGQIKGGMGFRRYLYRGLSNVRSEWNLVCAAFNLKKMAALLQRKELIGPLEGVA